MKNVLVLTLLGVLLGASPARAQFDTGALLGTVRDGSLGVLPGVTVTLRNVDTGTTAVKITDGEGAYEFFTVRIGLYLVSAELTGFSTKELSNLKVDVGARVRVDLELSVGRVAESVTVVGASPLVETDSSQRGHVVTGDQIRELALNGREYSMLALMSPGVRQSSLNKSTNATPREGAFNVNGLRSTFNNFLIDGVDNNAYGTSNQGFSNQVIQPPPDAVGEFRVVTNNQSAEYGRAAGATVNVAYRSGTNAWRGDVWEFFRDTALNATTYFKPVDGTKPPLRRNQFGGALGGPIVRNRAFFFADYEGFRQNRKATVFSSIPSVDQKKGIFAFDVRDPRTGVVYPAGTAIPMTPLAQKVMAGLPDPNIPGTVANNYSVLAEFTNESDKAGGKVDLTLSPSVSLFGRYGWRDMASVDQPQLPLPSGGGGNGTIYVQNKQLVLGSTWVASADSLLEVRLGWSHTQGGKNPPGLGTGNPADIYGIPGLPTDPRISGGLPTQGITGYTALGRQATNPQWQYPSVWNPKINYSWLMGRQSLKAGYEFQWINVEVQDVNPLYGQDTYSGQFTKIGTAANTAANISDFMLGLRSQYAMSTLFVAQKVRQNLHFLYLQDDFRLTDRLTVNAGLRYEYTTPMWERDNRLTNFDPTRVAMMSATDGSVADRALVDPDRNNLAPRLGLAYTVAPLTVVRGGWGTSYVHVNRIGSANILAINGPQVVRSVVNQSDPTAATFRATDQGYPADITDPSRFTPAGALVSYIPRDFRSGRVQSWYASVQREFGPRMLIDVAYVGNTADDLLELGNFNQANPNNAAGTIPLANRRPIPTFGDITYVHNGGRSTYRALEVKYDWRMAADVQLRTALTLSTAKDNAAGSLENQNGNFPGPQDINDLDADFGLSGYHQPYNTTTSFVIGLPFGRGKRYGADLSPAMNALVSGWQIAGTHVFTPGEMVTFTYTPAAAFQVSGIPNDFSGLNNYRPNVVCDELYAAGPSPTQYLNSACLAIPTNPSQPFGNSPRNSVRGPNFWNVDLAASKNIPVGQARMQLRLEIFNLFNRVNFAAPNGVVNNVAFGTITNTFDQRQVQLGAKINW